MRAWILGLMLVLSACTPAQKNVDAKATTDLKETLTDYNMKMRWGLWEQAAQYVDPAFKQAFLGELEERGEDYKIVNIDSRNVIFDGPTADVEYEMEWYTESMVVKKDKFVDRWVQVGGLWLRQETMTKDEWRDRKKKVAEEAAKAAKASQTNNQPAATNNATDQAQTLEQTNQAEAAP
ncbi:MAG: hypothetical protein R3E66_03295 [bacterium]